MDIINWKASFVGFVLVHVLLLSILYFCSDLELEGLYHLPFGCELISVGESFETHSDIAIAHM